MPQAIIYALSKGWPLGSGQATAAVALSAPVNLTLPVISGTVLAGSALTTSNGTWTNSPTGFTYQWFVAGLLVSTATTYTPISNDGGKYVTVTVTATNIAGPGSATSIAVGPVATGAALGALTIAWSGISDLLTPNTVVATITGRTAGSALYMTGAAFASGALAIDSLHNTIVVGVAGPLAFFTSTGAGNVVEAGAGYSNSPNATAFSAQTITTTRPVITAAPVVSGSLPVGSTLTTTNGTYNAAVTTYAYQWYAGTNPVGTNQNTYVTQPADAGLTPYCVVTASNAGGNSGPNQSNTLGAITPIAVPTVVTTPTIAGAGGAASKDFLYPGQVLTATAGTYTNAPTGYARQWQRGGVNISGATALTYTLVTADLGTLITFVETPSNGSGSGAAQTSNTIKIGALYAGFNVTDGTSLSGYVSESGHTFTASGGTWSIANKRAYSASGTYHSDVVTTTALAAADCFIQFQGNLGIADGTGSYVGLRATGSLGTSYQLGVPDGGSISFTMSKTVGTTQTQVATVNLGTGSFVGAHLIRFEAIGSNPTVLNAYIDGVLKLTYSDSASPITAAGRIQIYGANSTDQAHVQNFANLTAGAA